MSINTNNYLKAIGLLCLVCIGNLGYGQQATYDKNKRHDPMIGKPGYVLHEKSSPLSTVITVNDFDNFKLGVDFAECSITINPMNPTQMYAAWNLFGTSPASKGYRTDNGYDWTESTPPWLGMGGDVVVTSDNTGRLLFENMYGTNIQGAKVATSPDFGGTWDPIVLAIEGEDKCWIAADQTTGLYSKYLYATMTATDGGNLSESTDQGKSFTNVYNFTEHNLPGMMACVGPKGDLDGGSLFVVTNSGSTYASKYTFYESGDGGKTYTRKSEQYFCNYVGTTVAGRNAVENMRTRPYPYIAADNSQGPHRGRLYLVYATNFPSGNGNKPDVFCRHSDDGGSSWSDAVTVNDDTAAVKNNNWFPAIWNDLATGRLYISWMDTRDCPTSDSALIYASYSDDGETFARNQPVSTKKMKINCTTCGGGGFPAYYGDYNGVASNGKVAILAWTDFREGTFGSYVGYFPDYALRVEPAIDTLIASSTIYIRIPAVKLYNDSVFVSASVDSSVSDLIQLSFPNGNKIWHYPDSIPVQVRKTGNLPPGDYSLHVTTNGPNGTPVHKRDVIIRAVPPPAPVAKFKTSDTLICENTTLGFTDLSTGPPSQWMWSFLGAVPDTSNEVNPGGIVYKNAGSYKVSLTVTNVTGTNSITKTNYITVNPNPVVDVKDVATCGNQKVTLDATISNPGSYLWKPTDATTAKLQVDTLGRGLGKYTYQVFVKDVNGCINSDSAVATFFDCTGLEEMTGNDKVMIYPNPNSGQFSIKGKSTEPGKYDLAVFNSLGMIIYRKSQIYCDKDLNIRMELPDLPNGMYLLSLTGKHAGFKKRFILNR